MKNSSWVDIIYDVYDFLYWEPQHIWKIKNINSNLDSKDKVENHIRNMEVSLNQILNIFFYFLPNEIYINFVENIIRKKILKEDYKLYLKDVENIIEDINWSTQPDFFFIWDSTNIFIEMKLNSKSSLEQFMKYIFLHIKDCERVKKEKRLILIFLSKWDFSALFKEEIYNIDDLKNKFNKYKINDYTRKWNVNLVNYKSKIYDVANAMDIWHVTYDWFYNFFNNYCCNKFCSDREKDLINWILEEFKNRNLVS